MSLSLSLSLPPSLSACLMFYSLVCVCVWSVYVCVRVFVCVWNVCLRFFADVTHHLTHNLSKSVLCDGY